MLDMAKRGRPEKDAEQRKDEYLELRLSREEKLAFRKAADSAGLTLAAWARNRLTGEEPPKSDNKIIEPRQKLADVLRTAGGTVYEVKARTSGVASLPVFGSQPKRGPMPKGGK